MFTSTSCILTVGTSTGRVSSLIVEGVCRAERGSTRCSASDEDGYHNLESGTISDDAARQSPCWT